MSEDRPDPGPIMKLATGYWDSAALLAANDLNLFGVLAERPLTLAEVAARLDAGSRGVEMLLDACVGLGLLQKETSDPQPRYANSAAAMAFLVPDRQGYLGGAIRWSADQYPLWGSLVAAIRSNAPVVPPSRHLGDDPQETRTFVMAMHYRALGTAHSLLPFLDLSGVSDLLDVGGGPATYSLLLARKYPQLRATVLDLPGITAIAEELIAQAEMGERVRTRAGDAVRDDYGEAAFDAVLFSGVLHQMGAEVIREMLCKARRALRPGGRLIVSDVMLDDTKTQPPFATLFSLQMLLTSASGAVFSDAECADWLEQTEFERVEISRLPPPLPYVVVQGIRVS